MRRMRLIPIVAAVALTLAGTSCGDKAASAETIVKNSPAKTQQAKTARVAMVVTSQVGATPINVNADGVMDLANRKGELTMDLGQAIGGTVKVELFGTTMFMQLPEQLASQIPGGKPFVKIDLQQLGKQQGINFSALQQNPDATAQLDYLKGVSNDVHEVGKETLRGTATTHYQGTIDLKKAAATAKNADAKAAIEKVEQQLGVTTFPVDVWIDGQGRLRKMAYVFDMSKVTVPNAGAQSLKGTMNISLELFDYGVKVNVTEPAPDQVTDLSALLSQASSGGKKP